MARPQKWALGAGVFLVLAALLEHWFVRSSGIACGDYTVRVRGRLLDAAGEPVAGVWVMTFPDWDWLGKREFAERQKRTLRSLEGSKRTGDVEETCAWTLSGGCTTRADGSFDAYVGVPCSVRTGPLGIDWGRTERTPFRGVRVLRVERAGLPHDLVDCTKGTWQEHGDAAPVYATVDLGDVPLP